jgi:hypothetical protein
MAEVEEDEEVSYEGRGAPAELIISLLLGGTLLYLVRSIQLSHNCTLQPYDSTILYIKQARLHATCQRPCNAAADSAVDWQTPLDQLQIYQQTTGRQQHVTDEPCCQCLHPVCVPHARRHIATP